MTTGNPATNIASATVLIQSGQPSLSVSVRRISTAPQVTATYMAAV